MENNQSFWQFSDQLRLHTTNLENLSLNDSIWSNSYVSKRPPQERRNFDIHVGGEVNLVNSVNNNLKPNFNNESGNSWKIQTGSTRIGSIDDGVVNNSGQNMVGGVSLNGGFNKGIYNNSRSYVNFDNNYSKGNKNEHVYGGYGHGGKNGKKNKNGGKDGSNNENSNNGESGNKNGVMDKRFKTLPPSEALPRNESVGGYIFVCNNDTMQENLKRQLFGLPPRYRDSVRTITPGLPIFLYNYSTHQLHGIFEAASFGGTNIDPTAWEDKKNAGESRFPAQVRVMTRKVCEPLEEDSFRPILHHYDGPKFRLELNIPEALALLDVFSETNP